MKIFVISLKDARERRESSTAQLERAGLEFEFFDAINGEIGLRDYFGGYNEHEFLLNTGRTASAGEIGCFASHIALWKKCIEMQEAILILEDDFLLDDAFSDAVKRVDENIEEFGYIRLQSERRAKKRQVRKLGAFQLWRYTKAPHSSMCYAVSPSVAKSFVASCDMLTAPIDVHVKQFWEHGRPMYGLSPYTVTESLASAESTIQPRKKARKSLPMKVFRVTTKLRWFVSRLLFNLGARYRY